MIGTNIFSIPSAFPATCCPNTLKFCVSQFLCMSMASLLMTDYRDRLQLHERRLRAIRDRTHVFLSPLCAAPAITRPISFSQTAALFQVIETHSKRHLHVCPFSIYRRELPRHSHCLASLASLVCISPLWKTK